MAAGIAAAAAFSVFVGFLALRRVGIYFAMITLGVRRIVVFFGEFAAGELDRRRERIARRAGAEHRRSADSTIAFAGSWPSYQLVAGFYLLGFVFARFVVLSPVGAVLTAIRQNPQRTAALGHDVAAYKLAVFVLAAVFAGCGGALLGIFQSYMPPDAFALETSGQLVIQTVIGGAGTLIGPTVGAAIWLTLRDLLQQVPAIGDLWKFILGVVFVVLVTFMPNGIVGTIMRLVGALASARPPAAAGAGDRANAAAREALLAPLPAAAGASAAPARLRSKPATSAKPMAAFTPSTASPWRCRQARFHAIIGPNGAGKSTFLRLLKREETARFRADPVARHGHHQPPMSPRPISTGWPRATRSTSCSRISTVRQNLRIGALGRQRGRLRLDVFRSAEGFAKVEAVVAALIEELGLAACADLVVNTLPYGEKRRLELGLALASQPSVLLLDEPLAGLSPAEREGVKQLIRSLRKGRTIILVEHDMDAVFELAERITVLHEGRKLAEGTPKEISNDPRVREAYLGGMRHDSVRTASIGGADTAPRA